MASWETWHQRSADCERDEPGFGGFQDADVTVPSHGVGYEVARAEALGKPVLCLHRWGAGRRMSAMLAGNPGLRCEAYESVETLKPILERFLSG